MIRYLISCGNQEKLQVVNHLNLDDTQVNSGRQLISHPVKRFSGSENEQPRSEIPWHSFLEFYSSGRLKLSRGKRKWCLQPRWCRCWPPPWCWRTASLDPGPGWPETTCIPSLGWCCAQSPWTWCTASAGSLQCPRWFRRRRQGRPSWWSIRWRC